jgi:indole-3-glycerol phosphate synthase
MPSILDKIAEQKKQEIEIAKRTNPVSGFKDKAILPLRDFITALKTHHPAVIAEIKKASPSKGIIRADFDVASLATTYEKHGASCLSVLTDRHFFQGDPDYLTLAKQKTSLPALRKDFIIDSYQIAESRLLGADCILLIVAMLDDQQLLDFCQQAQELGMAVLVESHTQEELNRALRLPTPLMGINNRNLHTFATDIHTTLELAKSIPSDKLVITESGINSKQDVDLMLAHGISTFLIGESLMRAVDPGVALQKLIG